MSSKSSKSILSAVLTSAEAYATLRGRAVGEGSDEDRAAALVALASVETTNEALASEDEAYAAYIASGVRAQDQRADLAIAMLVLSAQKITNVAIAERFAVKGGSSAVATWLMFARWVLASSVRKAHPVGSADGVTRADALREGWNLTLRSKKNGTLTTAFRDVALKGAALDNLASAAGKRTTSGTPSAPATPPAGGDTPPANTPPAGDEGASLADDALALAGTLAADAGRLAHMIAVDEDGTISADIRADIAATLAGVFDTLTSIADALAGQSAAA